MTDTIRIKAIRLRILTHLNILYPTAIPMRALYRTVCDISYDETLFEKDVTYFFEKGWIEFVDNKIGGNKSFWNKVPKLTAKGKEIAEGTMTDEALEI